MSILAVSWALGQRVGQSTRKLVLLGLADHADEVGWSYPSMKKLAQLAECSPSTARSHLRDLEDAGLVHSIPRRRYNGSVTTNGYFLALPSSPYWQDGTWLVPEGPVQDSVPPPPESGAPPHRDPVGPPPGDRRAPHPATGGAPTGPPVGNEPSVETSEEPSEERGPPLEWMHTRWTDLTDNPRWQLLDTRAKRYAQVWESIQMLAPEADPRQVWSCMVRALWSDPWRREAKSHHDPANVYRTAAQRENWILEALDLLAQGRDGSAWGEQRRRGSQPREDAREEEAQLVARRLEAQRKARERQQEKDEAERERQEQELAELRAWYRQQPDKVKEDLEDQAEENLEALWPPQARRPGKEPPQGMVRAAWIQAARESRQREQQETQEAMA